jgi:hypothetical protein
MPQTWWAVTLTVLDAAAQLPVRASTPQPARRGGAGRHPQRGRRGPRDPRRPGRRRRVDRPPRRDRDRRARAPPQDDSLEPGEWRPTPADVHPDDGGPGSGSSNRSCCRPRAPCPARRRWTAPSTRETSPKPATTAPWSRSATSCRCAPRAQTDTALFHTISPASNVWRRSATRSPVAPRHRRRRPLPGRVRCQHGRRRDLLLAQHVRPQVLAPRHRDRPHRRRRQPRHPSRAWLDVAGRHRPYPTTPAGMPASSGRSPGPSTTCSGRGCSSGPTR